MSADPPTGAAVARRRTENSERTGRETASWPPLRRPCSSTCSRPGGCCGFGKGRRLIEENDSATEVFLLLSAGVKVTADLGGGRQRCSRAARGDVVGELAGVDGERRLATVTACGREPVIAAVLKRTEFDAVLERHPEAQRALSAWSAAKFRTATRRRVDFAGATSEIRLARALAELAEDYGRPIPEHGTVIRINLTQIELGTLVGGLRGHRQRSLRMLRERNLSPWTAAADRPGHGRAARRRTGGCGLAGRMTGGAAAPCPPCEVVSDHAASRRDTGRPLQCRSCFRSIDLARRDPAHPVI